MIPWIVFGFKNPDKNLIGLNQTEKSLRYLILFEGAYWLILYLLMGKPDPDIAGQGSFAWTYAYLYEKGIFPAFMLLEQIDGKLGDKVDAKFPFIYFITALAIDYLLLKIISPSPLKIWSNVSK
ncbi:hypothetical protein ACD591_21175 [Rufibacter glacialis]|uniref:Uncharacterized protein n=1 Tax=Rufibacter glacialis TaxID=1259555 RepID=A0ABV4RKZ1_9BACT|nr:hypothetical protein [Rufibacter glacialis]